MDDEGTEKSNVSYIMHLHGKLLIEERKGLLFTAEETEKELLICLWKHLHTLVPESTVLFSDVLKAFAAQDKTDRCPSIISELTTFFPRF